MAEAESYRKLAEQKTGLVRQGLLKAAGNVLSEIERLKGESPKKAEPQKVEVAENRMQPSPQLAPQESEPVSDEKAAELIEAQTLAAKSGLFPADLPEEKPVDGKERFLVEKKKAKLDAAKLAGASSSGLSKPKKAHSPAKKRRSSGRALTEREHSERLYALFAPSKSAKNETKIARAEWFLSTFGHLPDLIQQKLAAIGWPRKN